MRSALRAGRLMTVAPSIRKMLAALAKYPDKGYIQESTFGLCATISVIGTDLEDHRTNKRMLNAMVSSGFVELEDPESSPKRYYLTPLGREIAKARG